MHLLLLPLITVTNPQKDYVAICPNCSKQIYILTCKGCGETFPYPEEDPGLDHKTNTWECEKCGEVNKIPYPNELLKTKVMTCEEAPKVGN